MKLRGIFLTVLAAAGCLSAVASYTLTPKSGRLPDGVSVGNLSGCMPVKVVYKNGWTDAGWTVDAFGDRRNVLVSPSYMADGETCENALTLPPLTVVEGEWLQWDAVAVLPEREESYAVEVRQTGSEEWTLLSEETVAAGDWSVRMKDLSAYAGKEVEIRFVCHSVKGYMLALDRVRVEAPVVMAPVCRDHTPVFFGRDDLVDGCATVDFEILNAGRALESEAVVSLSAAGAVAEECAVGSVWPTGETRVFSMPLPLPLNTAVDYSISLRSGTEDVLLSQGTAYCTSFRRRLLVDKGTGMWCNNCPAGAIEIENLEREYGDAVIAVDTHNGDPLANDNYFSWLGFRSIPRLILNRIRSTAGENAGKFAGRLYEPVEMEVAITGLSVRADGSLDVKADVRTSADFSDSDRTYRIGYVLTRDVAGDEDVFYYQENNCLTSSWRQYYYLPSRIPFTLARFPNVSLPSPGASLSEDVAFTGIEGSLPESLEAGQCYGCEWNIPVPEGYSGFSGMRLVAMVIDAGSRNIVNSTAVGIDGLMGVGDVLTDDGADAPRGVYTIDGRRIEGGTRNLAPGIYVIDGRKVAL